MESKDFLDILTKIKNVFKTDMYIVDGMYCIGGEESESKNVGTNLCVLSSDATEYIKDIYGKHTKVIYITNLAEAKKSYGTSSEYLYVKTSIDAKTAESVINKAYDLVDKTREIEEWKQFHFTEDQLIALFTDGEGIYLFSDDEDLPEVFVSKSIFPMITAKNVSNLYYSDLKEKKLKDVYSIVTSFDAKYFQLYSLIRYVDV